MKIGLSLSGCVEDIATGLIDYSDVMCIIAGIKAPTFEDYNMVIEQYYSNYWRKPEQSKDIAIKLWNENKIYQPRLEGIYQRRVSKELRWQDPALLDNPIHGFSIEFFNTIVKRYRKEKIKNI